jgi:hypothetical protein
MRLRAQGYKYRVIAAKLGYATPQGAHRAIQRTIDAVTAVRNYNQWSRKHGGRPHGGRPSPEEGKRLLGALEAQIRADAHMNAERLEIAKERLERTLAGKSL